MLTDDQVSSYIDSIFGNSKPGDSLHHFFVASAAIKDCDAFGNPPPDKIVVQFCFLAPDASVDVSRFMQESILMTGRKLQQDGHRAFFAGLSMEVNAVINPPVNEHNAIDTLYAQRRLSEHPLSVEITTLYAAARDGRRWTGQHTLTGPNAGAKTGPTVRTGHISRDERSVANAIVRGVVGLGPAL